MTKKLKIAGAAMVVIVLLGTLRNGCKQREDVLVAPVLKDNENQKIIVDTNRQTVTRVRRIKNATGKTTQTTRTESGVRKVVVSEDNEGNISVSAINKGFCFEPGLALYFSDKARLGLDAQVAYWRRFGVVAGAGVNLGDEPRTLRLHIAVTHALPFDFASNTSMFVGVDNKKDVVAGLRLQF
jgi:hypothetical protein